jgi:hypothetical protein
MELSIPNVRKCLTLISGVSVGASVFTITAMSIDRYLAIRHPMAFRKIFNKTTTLFVSIIPIKLVLSERAVECSVTLNCIS